MKIEVQTRPIVFTRSMLALGFGCALAILPSGAALAQDTPRSPGQVDTSETKSETQRLHTDSTMPEKPKTGEKSENKISAKEKQFMNKAAAGNTAEVQLAELEIKQGEKKSVKEFAEKMIKDHTLGNQELKEIATKHGIDGFEPVLNDADKATYAEMTQMSGTALDTAYVKHAVVDHEEDVKEYKKGMGEVKDPMLMAYVEKTTPVIEGHLKMAKELKKSETAVANH